jgi:hypothetical protein
LFSALVAAVGHPDPQAGAAFAIAAGALVERGFDPAPWASALRAPLTRTLIEAERCLRLAEELEDEEAISDGVEIGDAVLSAPRMQQLVERAPLAVRSFFSLGIWYRPAVACWTRDRQALREAQADAALQAALAPVQAEVEGGPWLSILSQVVFEAPFLAFFPELEEVYAFQLSGCADNGQLMMLLSDALADPLGRIGAGPRASAEVLALARGEGPPEIEANFSARFIVYPWRALDPATGSPVDNRFTWRAPGGTGTHSLPPDFLPGAIEPIDGTRALRPGPEGQGQHAPRARAGRHASVLGA